MAKQADMSLPCMLPDMPFAEYAAAPGMNSSAIKQGVKSLYHMRHYLSHERPDTPPFAYGRMLHAAILETNAFCAATVIWDGDKVKERKRWKEFKEENEGRYIQTAAENADVMRAVSAVHSKSMAHSLIEQTRHEVSMFWDGQGYGLAKARLDGVNDTGSVLVDFKTAANIEERAFFNQAYHLGYHIQFGWYAGAIEHVIGSAPERVYVIVLEKKTFDVAVLEVPPGIVREGREKAIEIAHAYHTTEVSGGTFCGVMGDASMMEYRLPDWATKDEVDMEGCE